MDKSFVVNGEEVKVQDYKLEQDRISFTYKGKNYSFSKVAPNVLRDTETFRAYVGESMVISRGREAVVTQGGAKFKKAAAVAGSLTSPMPGKIFKVLKTVGEEVKKGEPILILEAMKMEHSIRSDKDGKIKNLPFKPGQLVQGGVVLAEVE